MHPHHHSKTKIRAKRRLQGQRFWREAPGDSRTASKNHRRGAGALGASRGLCPGSWGSPAGRCAGSGRPHLLPTELRPLGHGCRPTPRAPGGSGGPKALASVRKHRTWPGRGQQKGVLGRQGTRDPPTGALRSYGAPAQEGHLLRPPPRPPRPSGPQLCTGLQAEAGNPPRPLRTMCSTARCREEQKALTSRAQCPGAGPGLAHCPPAPDPPRALTAALPDRSAPATASAPPRTPGPLLPDPGAAGAQAAAPLPPSEGSLFSQPHPHLPSLVGPRTPAILTGVRASRCGFDLRFLGDEGR